MTKTTPTLAINNVTKAIAGREILTACNLALEAGEICAIIGPNGAGKTTLLKTIAGLSFPTAGEIVMHGQRFDRSSQEQLLPAIGAMIEAPEFRAGATATQVLQLHFDLLGLAQHTPIEKLLARVGLRAAAAAAVASFSLGMKQRLALARAIGHQPRLLILDEPTNGLDPTGVSELRALIAELAAAGTTILIASHALSELERTAHSVAVLTEGRLGEKRSVSAILAGRGNGLEALYDETVNGETR